LNVPARKDQAVPAERRMARAPVQALEWVRVEFVVRCIRRVSTPQVRLVRVRECPGVRALELLVQVSARLLEWRRRRVQAIVHRADMRNGVAETIATKSRRKVQ
jgi:hypothetical protein